MVGVFENNLTEVHTHSTCAHSNIVFTITYIGAMTNIYMYNINVLPTLIIGICFTYLKVWLIYKYVYLYIHVYDPNHKVA